MHNMNCKKIINILCRDCYRTYFEALYYELELLHGAGV